MKSKNLLTIALIFMGILSIAFIFIGIWISSATLSNKFIITGFLIMFLCSLVVSGLKL